jgi:hypothetical protein
LHRLHQYRVPLHIAFTTTMRAAMAIAVASRRLFERPTSKKVISPGN